MAKRTPKPRGRWDKNTLVITGTVRDDKGEPQTLVAFIYRHRGFGGNATFTVNVQDETLSNRYGEGRHFPSEDAAKWAAESALRKMVEKWIRARKAEIRREVQMLRLNKILW